MTTKFQSAFNWQIVTTYHPLLRRVIASRAEYIKTEQLPEYPNLDQQLQHDEWDLRDQIGERGMP